MPKPSQHPDETSLLKDLKDLKKRVQALEGQTRLESASIGRGGVTIRDGGELKVVDDEGQIIGWIGYTDTASDPEGHPQSGFVFYAEDRNIPGRQAIPKVSLLDWGVPVGMPERPYVQTFTLLDTNAANIINDDAWNGGFNTPQFNVSVTPGGDGFNGDWLREARIAASNYHTRNSAWPANLSYPLYTVRSVKQHNYLLLGFYLVSVGGADGSWNIVLNSSYGSGYYEMRKPADHYHSEPIDWVQGPDGTWIAYVEHSIDLSAVTDGQGMAFEQSYSAKIRVNQSTDSATDRYIACVLTTAVECGPDYENWGAF